MISVCRRRSVSSKLCAKRFCKICELCERKYSPASLKDVLFLTENTDEQNTRYSTETLSQPISQNVTANLSWKASVTSVCRRPSVGSKLCAKMLSELCALCERKKCPLWEKELPTTILQCSLSHRVHRRTEHTAFHRDIKSTDFTEPYSQQNTHSHPRSFQEHALLHSRTCPSTSKNTPFLMLDKALL